MSIAYLISAHTDAPQLKRLIDALHSDAQFFVHVDRKSDIRAFTTLLQGENIHFVDNRIDVIWGTIRQVEDQMALMQAVLNYPMKFDRIFFLSGLDYPLWSNDHITAWLEAHPDQEFMAGYCMDTDVLPNDQRQLYQVARPFCHIHWLNRRWNECLRVLCRKIKKWTGVRKPLFFTVNGERWHLYKGADWWCVSQGLLNHIYEVYTRTPEVRRYFADSFAPSETLPQTIAFNSPRWASKCILHQGSYPGLTTLTPLHCIVYDPVIKVMDETDYPMLMASGKMFARKFVSGKSDQLIQMLHARN